METLFAIPADFSALTVEELHAFIASARETAAKVAAGPKDFLVDGRDTATLMDEMTAGVAAIGEAKAELAKRETEPEETETEDEPAAEAELDTEALAALAAEATAEETPAETATEPAPVAELAEVRGIDVASIVRETVTALRAVEAPVEETETEAVTAAAEKPTRRLPLGRSRSAEPLEVEERVAMVAAAENLGYALGQELGDTLDIAKMMVKRRKQFGTIPEGTHGEKIPIARADWADLYPEDRRLGSEIESNLEKIEAVVASARIRDEFEKRLGSAPSLTASGGLCAPVTPYYNLQMISVADRPVRGALPAFNADRGGINAARPAALSAITDAVGIITEAEDAAGGTFATKTCQRIACPTFTEVDVATIYHCLEFGNLGSRTFPELVSQWQSLVLAAHARAAETALLDGIGGASTDVTAGALGLGASATLPSQIITAANGLRSRNRMASNAVLRVLLPSWVLDLLVSDVYRSQFQRFDMTPEQFVAILRRGNVEPTFYIDGQTGSGQVFGAQSAGALLNFPDTVVWYIYPEGSFLYLDGGVLELGLVRDSVLNATNDFQIFGESFENVAFIGVESLKVTTTVCDSGTVSLPDSVTCPINY